MADLDILAGLVTMVLFIAYYSHVKHSSKQHTSPLPPGPRKLPLIGNLLVMPTKFPWVTYHEWCKEFDSDIIHLNVAGTSIVILDSSEAVMELLERRSSIYSGRARFPMLTDLMKSDFLTGFMPYGDSWRQHRGILHNVFHSSAVKQFRPRERKATHGLLGRLLNDPDSFIDHIRLMAGEVIMSITYGIEILPKNDPYVAIAEKANRHILLAGVPGAFLVDVIPILKYMPDWVPFASFKRVAKEWREMAKIMTEMPFDIAKRNIANGNAMTSFVSCSLEHMDKKGNYADQESILKSAAAAIYIAGSDTTLSALATCILGLLTRPEVLKKAQEEIDLIVGANKLPDFDDEHALPYITAVVKETLRWRNVTPIAIPHLSTAEDEYKGYRIPAGSTIIPNAWAMLHNEIVYPEPFEFKPERFMKGEHLDPEAKDPAFAAFGFGRRMCPGRHMAFSSIWITVASIIATFDITKAVDEIGEIIEPSHEYTSTFVSAPLPFKCSFKPRSNQAEKLIRSSLFNK